MRDKNRIEPLLDKLRAIWFLMPDMRFNQLIIYLQHEFYKHTKRGNVDKVYEYNKYTESLEYVNNVINLFNIEDDEFYAFLEWKLKQLEAE
jgi:hypothetical protein